RPGWWAEARSAPERHLRARDASTARCLVTRRAGGSRDGAPDRRSATPRVSGPSASDRQTRRRPDLLVASIAAETWGVLSLDELRGCGLSRDAVSVRVRRGWLHPLHRGVYAVGHANPPLEGRFLAAVKACGPHAVLSHYSAAALWGFLAWDDRHREVTVVG